MDNPPSAAQKRGHALLLATSEYQDSRLSALRLPDVDLAALREILDDPKVGHYAVADILNQPCQDLKARIGSFFSSASAEETLLLYIAGHAVKDLDGEIYIAATDTRLDQLPWTGIEAGFIQKVAAHSKCRRLLLILDTCFNGIFPPEHAPGTGNRAALAIGVQERFRDNAGMVLITPSGEIQYALHGSSVDTLAEPALLAKQIIDGLSTGKADFQDDGQITAEELFRYVLRERRLDWDTEDDELQRRRPQRWSFNLDSDLTVASNAMLQASALSKDLVELIENVSFRARLLAVEDLAGLLGDQSPALARAARGALEHLQGDPDQRVSQVASSVLQKARKPSPADRQRATPESPLPGASLLPRAELAGNAQETPPSPVLHRSGITTWLLRYFHCDLAIDLGMTNTVIYDCLDRRVVLEEPSMLTAERVRDNEWKILAVGSEARSMLGRTPEAVEAVRPMKEGVIADFYFAEKMLRYFVNKVLGSHVVRPSPRVLMCVPFSATPVERHMFRECARSTGARQVRLVSKSIAAAIGAGLPVSEARASVVLYVGGAISEIAVLSLARIVIASSVRLGGDDFDQAIMSYVRQTHSMLIGEATAEHIKRTAGAARRGEAEITVTVKGHKPSEPSVRTIVLSSDDIADALEKPIQALINLLNDALHQTPPELLADAAERGVVLAGGGALLRGLDRLLAEKIGLPVILANDPTTCVVRGAAGIFEFLDEGGHHFDLE